MAETDLFQFAGPASPAARALDDALYYLRRGCGPCADRHFELALRHGASQDQVDAVRVRAAAAGPDPEGPPA